MATALVTRRPKSSATRRTWSTISPGPRSRASPPAPVAQKAQPIAHPAWVEKHTVRRSPLGSPTVSTVAPSASPTRYLRVPSADSWRSQTSRRRQRQPAREGLSQAGRQVRHLVEGADAPPVEPALDLLGAEARLPEFADERLEPGPVERLDADEVGVRSHRYRLEFLERGEIRALVVALVAADGAEVRRDLRVALRLRRSRRTRGTSPRSRSLRPRRRRRGSGRWCRSRPCRRGGRARARSPRRQRGRRRRAPTGARPRARRCASRACSDDWPGTRRRRRP